MELQERVFHGEHNDMADTTKGKLKIFFGYAAELENLCHASGGPAGDGTRH